eukprot:3037003-Prymnesium_polylepis.1
MVLAAEDGFNHPQRTGCNRPLIRGREGRFCALGRVCDMHFQLNSKSREPVPPSAVPSLKNKMAASRNGREGLELNASHTVSNAHEENRTFSGW